MQTVNYMTSLLTFYLKGEICQEQNFVNIKKPNTVLGLISFGAKKESIPVSQLSSVGTNFKLKIGTLLLGAIFLLIGLSLFTTENYAAGLILLILGVNNAIAAFETILTIKTTAGEIKNISFLIFDKAKAEKAEKMIRDIISNRLDDTNNRVQTNRIVDAINNK